MLRNGERWIEGYENEYSITKSGRVYKWEDEERIPMNTTIGSKGYERINFRTENGQECRRIHELLLKTFVRKPEPGEETRHKNGLKLDNRLSNIEWSNPSENAKDRIRHGEQARGEDMNKSDLTADDVREIRERADEEAYTQVANDFDVSESTVGRIYREETWTHV